MFETGKTYWFVLKCREGFKDRKDFHIKGVVLEENAFMVKIETDKGNIEIIPLNRVIDVNEAKNTEFTQGTRLNEGN